MSKMFSRSPASISRIFNHVLSFIHFEHGHLLTGIMNGWVSQNRLQDYVNAVHRKRSPLENCVGFIDGTMRPTCRPHKHQKVAYSGHKRNHGLKFQGVMFPDGMIGHLYGPIEGRRHDAGILREICLLEELTDNFVRADGSTFMLYGDPAYPISRFLLSPYKHVRLVGGRAEWNKRMSSVRQAVEWGFGNVIVKFAFLDFKKNQKIYC